MLSWSNTNKVLLVSWFLLGSANSFMVNHHQKTVMKKQSMGKLTSSTVLFLEDWVADMIDNELYRQYDKKEFNEKVAQETTKQIIYETRKANQDNDMSLSLLEDTATDMRQLIKDELLAMKDPQRYCADRCVATGSCEVYEDFFSFSPTQVLEFCTDCVLSEDEEPCDVPDAFYEEKPSEENESKLSP